MDTMIGQAVGTVEGTEIDVSTGITWSENLGDKARTVPCPFPPKVILGSSEKETAITIKIRIRKYYNCFHTGHDAGNASSLRHREVVSHGQFPGLTL